MTKIIIEITASKDKERCSLKHRGRDVRTISNSEIRTFNVEEEKLKTAVEKYFGRKPTDAFLRSPTPGDIYDTNNWLETKRIFSVHSFKLNRLETEQVSLCVKKVTNDSVIPLKYSVNLSRKVKNLVKVNWIKSGGALTVLDPIDFYLTLLETDCVKELLNITVLFGKHAWASKELIVHSGILIEICPITRLLTELFVTKVEIDFLIDFHACLLGKTAVNYDPKYKDGNIFGFDIDEVLIAANMNEVVTCQAEVFIEFYIRSTAFIKTTDIDYS